MLRVLRSIPVLGIVITVLASVSFCSDTCGDISAPGERVIIVWNEDASDTDKSSLLENASFISEYDDSDFTIGTCTPAASALIKSSPLVSSFEPDSALNLCSLTYDPYSDTQWWLENTGSYKKLDPSGTSVNVTSTKGIDIDAEEGWAIYKSNISSAHPVIVAIIDTGIDYRHEDLADAMWVNEDEIPDNGIDDDNNGYIDDIYGWDFYNSDSSVCHYLEKDDGTVEADPADPDNHGTHIAGIIAARANNNVAISGIARYLRTSLMSLKIHGGPDRRGSVSDAVKAIRYAQAKGANVCNISWGSYSDSSALKAAIERSTMLFVCAAGNDGNDNDATPLYPAGYDLDNVLSVTYVDCDGRLSRDSCYGLKSVDIAAPSTDVCSTIVGSVGYLSGSSMAAPQVSAAAAILFSLKSNLSAKTVKDVILASARPLDSLSGKCTSGGMLNLKNCLENRNNLVRDTHFPEFTVTRSFSNGDINLTFDCTDDDEGSGINSLLYMLGSRSRNDFARGSMGTPIEGNSLTLKKGGFYTFCLYDNARNMTVKVIPVVDDMLPPVIEDASFIVSAKKNKFTITAKVTDSQSGLKSVKYLKGLRSVSDFLSDGTVLTPDSDNIVSFKETSPGVYTILATDYRGNKSLETIRTYIRTADSISLSDASLMLSVGDYFLIESSLSPYNSTDTVEFRSANENVAAVTNSGKITARGVGETTITAYATGGATATCTVTVTAAG